MNIHEHQAKEDSGAQIRRCRTRRARVAFSVDEAVQAAEALPGPVWVVKAQIMPAAAARAAASSWLTVIDEFVRSHADAILGMTLVTHQTGPEGKEVKRLLIEEGCDDRPMSSTSASWSTAATQRGDGHGLDRGRHGNRGPSPRKRPN